MCVSKSPTEEFCSIDFDAFINLDHHSASPNINFWFPQTDFPVKIKGSCRGLILLLRRPDIFCIWNPSTGFKKQIPFSPFDSKKVEILHARLYGFGYDESKDDYLVVLLSHEPTKENPFKSHFEIFSIRDNRWKVIEGTHFPYFGDREGLLLHRAIHWLTFRVDQAIYVIVAFDLMERKLFEIPLPDHFNQEENFNQEEQPIAFGLWIFGEFLSLWFADYDNHLVEIWVMKEYKLHSSWTKTLVIRVDHGIPFDKPVYRTKSGDIIGKDRDRLVKYNDKGQLVEYLYIDQYASQLAMYTESLFSLPGEL
jgi:F-box interacting protein